MYDGVFWSGDVKKQYLEQKGFFFWSNIFHTMRLIDLLFKLKGFNLEIFKGFFVVVVFGTRRRKFNKLQSYFIIESIVSIFALTHIETSSFFFSKQ